MPNDWTYVASEWTYVDLPAAYDLTSPGATSVIVAVIDSGCYTAHPDLNGRLVAGQSFVAGFSEPTDDAGHGTQVAGIIAAKGNNWGLNTNVAGVAWDANVKVMPLKFMKADGADVTGYVADAVQAIYYAVDHGARIINASWGFGESSKALEDAVAYARSRDVLFVASAGNDGKDNDVTAHYPSNLSEPNVIAVAAIDNSNDIATFSNYGYYSVDVAAPGVSIAPTTETGGVSSGNTGTSFAAPVVSAIAALLLNQNSAWTCSELRERLVTTSVIEAAFSQRLKDCNGVVNAYNALRNANVHAVHDEGNGTTPSGSGDVSTATASGGGGGGGCLVDSAALNSRSAWAFALLVGALLLAQVRRRA